MKTLTFANGDTLPILGLGTWKAGGGAVYNAVSAALRLGYRHIDCAPIYGNEAEVGEALADAFAAGIVRREELFVTSKLWNDAHLPEDVRPALARTLAHLRLDYLDLYLMHWPVAYRPGVQYHQSPDDFLSLEEAPLAITWGAMEDMAELGLCRHIGVSNFSAAKIEGLLGGARIRPEMNQVELHPYLQQTRLLEFCREHGVLLTAYSPLGSADRPDQLKKKGEPVLLEDPVIAEIAARHGATPAQILISWAAHRGTAVIPKSTDPGRLRENLAAPEIPLTADDRRAIAALDRHRRYISGAFWAVKGGPYTLAGIWDE